MFSTIEVYNWQDFIWAVNVFHGGKKNYKMEKKIVTECPSTAWTVSGP